MKNLFVYLNTGISLEIPDSMDVESEEVSDMIRAAFRDMIMSQEEVDYLIEEEL
jgi:hypothetical protein